MPTNGIVSSLIPKTAPPMEKSRASPASTSLSYRPARAMKRLMPYDTAPVALSIQKAPPTIRMKTMIPACFTKPL